MPPELPTTRNRRWRRWALIPPLLLLLIGLSVLAYRVTQPDWQGLQTGLSRRRRLNRQAFGDSHGASQYRFSKPRPPVTSPETEPEPDPPASPSTDVQPAAPQLLPSERILALADELAQRSRPRLDAFPSPPLDPVLNPAAPPPEAQKPIEAAEVWKDIQREANLKNKEKTVLESIKRQLLEEDLRNARQRQAEQAEHRRQSLAQQNQTFREELSEILSSEKPGTAKEIRKLASLPPPRPRPRTIDGQAGEPRILTLSRSLELRRAWVAKLRLDGQQDSVILSDLVEAHRLNRLSRGGPRTDDDAVLRAAIDLLSVPADARPDQIQKSLLTAGPSPRSPNSRPGTISGRTRYGPSRRH